MVFKILSFNVHGLNHPAKRASVWRKALKLQADVLCLQETNFAASGAPRFGHRQFPHLFFAPAKKCGVLIAVRDTVALKVQTTHVDPEGRYLILIGELNNKPFTVVTLYAPNSRQIRFLKNLFCKIASVRKGSLVVCGNYNSAADFTVDTTSTTKRPPPSAPFAL